jgi:hypothetical protein
LKFLRLAFTRCGDRIKYEESDEIEWVFSPRYGWSNLPKEFRDEITKYDLKWDFVGKYIPEVYRLRAWRTYVTDSFL